MLRLLLENAADLATASAALFALLAALHLQERWLGRRIAHQFGWRAVLVTGWLGVPLHELSHLLAARLFGHRIVGYALFDPDPVSGTLGYVRHAYTRRTAWQLLGYFFIGIAPALGGTLVLAALFCWMVGPQQLSSWWSGVVQQTAGASGSPQLWLRRALGAQSASWDLARLIWSGRTVWLPVQLYLALCVASHLAPSRADMSGAAHGLLLFFGALLATAAICAWRGISLTGCAGYLAPLALVVVLVGLLQAIYAAIAALAAHRQNRSVAISR